MENQTNTKIVHYKDYVAGWLDSSIHDFLEFFPRNSRSTDYALLTCIDSNLDPSSLLHKSPELSSLTRVARSLGRGLLLRTGDLLAADSNNKVFFGFDEVWFFPSEEIEPKPDSMGLVGPSRINQAILDDLGGWMSKNSCALALGDGGGLNFIIKARGLVKHLLGYSLYQPQPDAVFETIDS